MNDSEVAIIKRRLVMAKEKYKSNFREMTKLRKRLILVESRISRYGRLVNECEEILESEILHKS